MLTAKEVLGKQERKILTTTNIPKIIGVVYKFKGFYNETLYVSYDGSFLRYIDKKELNKINTTDELILILNEYIRADDDYNNVRMKPAYFTECFSEDDIKKLKRYHF